MQKLNQSEGAVAMRIRLLADHWNDGKTSLDELRDLLGYRRTSDVLSCAKRQNLPPWSTTKPMVMTMPDTGAAKPDKQDPGALGTILDMMARHRSKQREELMDGLRKFNYRDSLSVY